MTASCSIIIGFAALGAFAFGCIVTLAAVAAMVAIHRGIWS